MSCFIFFFMIICSSIIIKSTCVSGLPVVINASVKENQSSLEIIEEYLESEGLVIQETLLTQIQGKFLSQEVLFSRNAASTHQQVLSWKDKRERERDYLRELYVSFKETVLLLSFFVVQN